MTHNPSLISCSPILESDLLLVHKWLNRPEVAEWYKEPPGSGYPSLEYIIGKWLPRIRGKGPTREFIFSYDGKPIGHIQCARLDDNPAYSKAFVMEGNPAGIDLFIGEDEYRHRGLGSHIITRFLWDVVFVIYDADLCTIDPDPANRIAIRAYEKAGFRYVKTVWNPIDSVWAHIMAIARADICT